MPGSMKDVRDAILSGQAAAKDYGALPLPESMAARRVLGECLPKWDFQALSTFDQEPAHVLSRLVQTIQRQPAAGIVEHHSPGIIVVADRLTGH